MNEQTMDNKETNRTEQPENNQEQSQEQQTGNSGKEGTVEEDIQESGANEAEEQQTEKDPLEAAQEEIEQLKDKLLRTMAEFDNYKKRTIKEKAELILNGSEKTVNAILPVLDDFERALADKAEDAAAVREGMQLIFNKFNKTLEGMGVKKIDTDGKDFDVDFHEAIAMVPGVPDEQKGKVIDCVQTGYMLNEKVIRHAKVAVGQ
ncbi:MAG: nucleotide exchange factor GrpE [Prevotella sp.]